MVPRGILVKWAMVSIVVVSGSRSTICARMIRSVLFRPRRVFGASHRERGAAFTGVFVDVVVEGFVEDFVEDPACPSVC